MKPGARGIWVLSEHGRWPLVLFMTIGLFAIMKSFFHFPFITDDYWYLARVETQQFHPKDFGHYWARLPLWCWATWANFASGFAYAESWAYPLVFGLNTLCLMLLAREFKQRLDPESSLDWSFFVLILIFAFFPGDHEVLYWPTDWAFTLGSPLVYAGWRSRQAWQKILLYAAAFSFGEMHIMPALALELVPFLFEQPGAQQGEIKPGFASARDRIKKLGPTLVTWLAAVFLFISIRGALALKFGAYPHPLEFAAGLLVFKLFRMLQHFFVLSFYKDFWPPTLLYLTGILVILITGKKLGMLASKTFRQAGIFILITGSLACVMGYFTSRAFYGASLCVHALLIVLLHQALPALKRRWQGFSLSLIAVAFFGQTLFIFVLKDKNYAIMQGKEKALLHELQTCQEPCQIAVDSIPQGLKRGWVMHADYAVPFAEWVRARHRIDKKVEYTLGGRLLSRMDPAPAFP